MIRETDCKEERKKENRESLVYQGQAQGGVLH